jgi:hypothetical protein
MQVTSPPRSPVEGWNVKRDEWVAAVDRLVTEAEGWAREQNWLAHRGSKTITEDQLGTSDLPMLMMHCPQGGLILDPDGCDIVGASGRIDFRVFPSYDSVLIIRGKAGWQFVTNPPTVTRPWSKEALLEVANELALRR